MAKYKDVIVTAGSGGFGGPLKLHPDVKQNKIVNITGGVISPVAKRLAEMTGCELVDGFKTSVPDDEILAVVIDCGGTLRCGIYPQKRIQTINLNPTGPSGPLAQYIKPDIYVSAVREKDLAFAEGQEYVQPQDEWVLLVQGEARLKVDGVVTPLLAGDYLFLPAGTPHTVECVSAGAIWLAIHLYPESMP